MSREIEDRLRAALSAKAEQVGEGDLRPAQLPTDPVRPAKQRRRFRRTLPWLAPALAAAAVAGVVVVAVANRSPDRHSSSTNSAAGRAASSLPAPATPAQSAPAPVPQSSGASAQESNQDAALPPAVITVPANPTSGELKPLPSAVLGSAAFWPGGNSRGFGQTQPTNLNNGGDPSGIVVGITWQDWGLSSATGVGQTYLPKPGGGYYPGTVPIDLIATKLGRCGSELGYQQLFYRTPIKPGGSMPVSWQLWAGTDNLCQPR